MANGNKRQHPASRRILMTEQDAESARRLLSLLAPADSGKASTTSRGERVQHAQAQLDLRYRRFKVLGKPFAAEAPFAMLLALYASEAREPQLTLSRLTELARITHPTAYRWVELLENAGWIDRADDPEDARKVLLRLRPAARNALDELFGE